ncbi:radical SAM protein [Paraherbaspirillum soli]|uniref:Radical SAM protein n=1 Tax=Paraherbaspirillum soli TaxID=631222 RepID=A0ABW0MBJ1_9BURK
MLTSLKLSRYIVTSDLLSAARTGFQGRVVFPTRSSSPLTVDELTWRRIQDGALDALPPNAVQRLIEAKVLVPADEDEFAAVVSENMAAIEQQDVLYQVVQPSAWCQLDCSYCGQEHSKKWLGEEQQEEFLQRIRARLASGRYRHLKIGWFGAEPLTGLTVMRRLGASAQALAKELGCGYSARIISNGIGLTPAIARELLEQHCISEAEITLDGLAADHDRLRFTKTGKGSFRKIFDNLRSVAAATELKLVIRCNVDRLNADGVAPLIEQIAQAGLAQRVQFYTSPVYAWGNDADQTALDREEFAQCEVEWLALQMRLGFQVGLLPPRRKIVCMSVQREAEVVDAYGATFNCTEVPYVPAYGQPNSYEIRIPVSSIKVRSGAKLHAGSNETPANKLHNFNQQLLQGEHLQCASCNMLPVCGGQCPKSWHEGHAPCPSAKINMKERLNLLFAADQMTE